LVLVFLLPLSPLYIPLRSDKTLPFCHTSKSVLNFISHYVQIKHLLLSLFFSRNRLYIPLRSDKTRCSSFEVPPVLELYIPLRSDKTKCNLITGLPRCNFISHYVQIKLRTSNQPAR